MEPFLMKNESCLLVEDWIKGHNGLIAGFTTKNGGKSEEPFSSLNLGFHVHDKYETVCANREIAANSIGLSVQSWVGAQQTHESRIEKISKKDRGRGALSYETAFKRTDGFFTFEKGILLTLCFADCVPLFFYAPHQEAIGLVHAGWRGSVQGIASEMISTFNKEGIGAQDVLVVVGPSICENCYIVDDKVIEIVNSRLAEDVKKPYNLSYGNHYKLNLQKFNKQILLQSGVPEQNIRMTKYCTSCHHDLFFSHRRDKGQTGRMMSFIGWKED